MKNQIFLFQKQLTIFKKKSTCGLLCTKNRTGCRSIVTLRMKSGGVPGLTVGRSTPSWNECISVSSRSKINVLRLTMPKMRNSSYEGMFSMRGKYTAYLVCVWREATEGTSCTL